MPSIHSIPTTILIDNLGRFIVLYTDVAINGVWLFRKGLSSVDRQMPSLLDSVIDSIMRAVISPEA